MRCLKVDQSKDNIQTEGTKLFLQMEQNKKCQVRQARRGTTGHISRLRLIYAVGAEPAGLEKVAEDQDVGKKSNPNHGQVDEGAEHDKFGAFLGTLN